jgi:thiol-disulfide isomerase/thioredoxin
MLFYLLILSLILPFSRKYVAVGLNKAVMHRPAIIKEENRETLSSADYDWVMADRDGNLVPFSQFSGEIVFLSFWATWCPPCRAEMPNIQHLHDAFREDVSFVLVSMEQQDVLDEYMDKHGYDISVYRMVQNLPEKLQSSSIPTTFLISPEGEIQVKKTGAAKWDGRFFREYLRSELDRGS